jgi:hypothetical protein
LKTFLLTTFLYVSYLYIIVAGLYGCVHRPNAATEHWKVQAARYQQLSSCREAYYKYLFYKHYVQDDERRLDILKTLYGMKITLGRTPEEMAKENLTMQNVRREIIDDKAAMQEWKNRACVRCYGISDLLKAEEEIPKCPELEQ